MELGDDSVRGGLLRHGSILTVTSFATRTSPVVRGNWVLDNLLGVPPPPPPPDIPDLPKAKIVARELPIRERLSAHRDNPACSGCHRLMDPVGFALENYDAIGRWRTVDTGRPIDASGELWDGSAFDGVAELEAVLLARPELFLTTLTEKLLVFATGRGVTPNDGPAVRSILRQAKADDYRMSSLIRSHRRERPLPDEESIIMILTKKALPRRTFLRGMGAAIALPLLDAMVPSMTAWAKTAAKPVRRLGFVYVPMGSDITRWTPPGTKRRRSVSCRRA